MLVAMYNNGKLLRRKHMVEGVALRVLYRILLQDGNIQLYPTAVQRLNEQGVYAICNFKTKNKMVFKT